MNNISLILIHKTKMKFFDMKELHKNAILFTQKFKAYISESMKALYTSNNGLMVFSTFIGKFKCLYASSLLYSFQYKSI